ncbi:hypothetical protein PM082_022377 [Marasmius tenuissimus]|nr:hypothetical protein PM082_022377 [Marasmius tenuissimus]
MKPTLFTHTVLFVVITLSSLAQSRLSVPLNATVDSDTTIGRFVRRGDPDVLPTRYWRLAKSQEEIEDFRARYNLTMVSAEPQDAALLPSWPQALLQYLLINPIINISSNGIGCWDVAQYISLPPCFIAWIISFARIQSSEKATAGWISIIGWASWLCLYADLPMAPGVWVVGLPSVIFAAFQWCASSPLS